MVLSPRMTEALVAERTHQRTDTNNFLNTFYLCAENNVFTCTNNTGRQDKSTYFGFCYSHRVGGNQKR